MERASAVSGILFPLTVGASAAHAALTGPEGFKGSFIGAFLAFVALFIVAQVAALLWPRFFVGRKTAGGVGRAEAEGENRP